MRNFFIGLPDFSAKAAGTPCKSEIMEAFLEDLKTGDAKDQVYPFILPLTTLR
jgi:hypothetical protein